MDNQFEENPYFSNIFSSYMLNNCVGLAPLWTKFNIGDQLEHGISEPYTTWSSTHKDLDTVTNPPTTQGILELHNKSVKHVYLQDRIDRIDRIIQKLNAAKVSFHRQYRIMVSFNPLSSKFIKWSNTLKQFVSKLPANCLSVFDHFVGLALKGLNFVFIFPSFFPCLFH